ncbi:NUC153 domain-containing protein [Caenorhabditis elegans]|uniref:NUC153 domain-containing protein n=1 Tax=Caenorhabditis elegans TaxID=6239 RepID=Q19974_CAEEL|nr:NUC153 domain-containing protein [Caenorhabditis elegans]CCD70432.1 NUC153 domain-containing protein [Caenorhabditis elegans]|eukprot:NP_501233.1 NucleOLar protein [Caenorhabditis elegans]
MEVSTVNDVKIYNLSAGKSLPEWMSSRTRRKLEQRNTDVRQRIQLIQDFEMPDVSNTVNITPDGKYVWASGNYKPWLRCYDLNNLSLKFERGLDADVIKLIPLSDDYSKVVILEEERWIEMHAMLGRYFRMRMPCQGRDMALSEESSDLYLVGSKSEVYRFNLEQGCWLTPFESTAPLNCVQVCTEHQLICCGTTNGVVEAWDHRDKSLCGTLDAGSSVNSHIGENQKVAVTSVAFSDPLHIGVGTSTGQILIYDLRARRPLLIKDHNNELPINKLDFIKRDDGDVVASMDSRMMKLWHEEDGSPMAAIENTCPLNDFCRFPNSGMFFFANEAPKMLQYFIPQLGPAPKWCSYLENLTEEMEETETTVYDNYRFVTKKQLDDLGLSGLIGTNVLRAYMHGYFIDARLYNKAQTQMQPFAYEKYKDEKIKSMIADEREESAVKKKVEKLPAVNKALAARLRDEASAANQKAETKKEKKKSKKSDAATSLLADDRFKKLFESEDFEVDETSEQFLKNASIAQKMKAKGPVEVESEGEESEDNDASDSENEASGSDSEPKGSASWMVEENREVDMASDLESASSDEDIDQSLKAKRAKVRAAKKSERNIQKSQKYDERKEAKKIRKEQRQLSKPSKFVLHSIGTGETTRKFVDETVAVRDDADNKDSMALGARKRATARSDRKTKKVNDDDVPFGGREMTFTISKRDKDLRAEAAKTKQAAHAAERKEVSRRPNALVTKGLKKLPGNVNVGKRQNTF